MPDICDLMTSGQLVNGPACPALQKHTIDAKRNLYFGKDTYGVDTARLRVWKGSTDNSNLIAEGNITKTGNFFKSEKRGFVFCN